VLAHGDVVYVKGSHSVHLVRVVAAIKQLYDQHAAAIPA
jgi:UDP-N-acetylmuramyl pentapeptide synthase